MINNFIEIMAESEMISMKNRGVLRDSIARPSVLLSNSLGSKSLPAPNCTTDQVNKNIALAKELSINSTPTLIMPDGRVLPGYKKADKIIEALQDR